MLYVCSIYIYIYIYIYIEHMTFHITGWMIFPPIIRHAFWPRPLTSQPEFRGSDQNPAKIRGPKTPIPSMYGMSTVYLHLRLIFMVNVGEIYTIHGCCGYMWILQILILEEWYARTTILEEYAHCKCRLSMQDILYTHKRYWKTVQSV